MLEAQVPACTSYRMHTTHIHNIGSRLRGYTPVNTDKQFDYPKTPKKAQNQQFSRWIVQRSSFCAIC